MRIYIMCTYITYDIGDYYVALQPLYRGGRQQAIPGATA